MAAANGARSFLRRAGKRVRQALRRRLLRLARRVLRPSMLATIRLAGRLHRAPRPGGRVRIRILLQNAYGMGGTTRTVLNLAGHLGRRHDVEIVSMMRWAQTNFYPHPDGVTVRDLLDERAGVPGRVHRMLRRLPTMLIPPGDGAYQYSSLASDLALIRLMSGRQPHVVIGTRPAQNLIIADTVRPGVVTIGQDHTNLNAYAASVQRLIRRSYGRLAALTVLTRSALAQYEEALAGTPVRIVRIPNAVPPLGGGLSARTEKTVIAAGRYVGAKGFDLLIQAYEPVAAKHPDWTLRIFGQGRKQAELQKMIDDRGLGGQVKLMPRTPGLGAELARSSIYALSSRFEGLPLVVIEAMSKGVPTVAFDCPTGPAELITPGEDGLLVPPLDVPAFTAGLLELIEDAGLRDRLGERALQTSLKYEPTAIGAHWDTLVAGLCSGGTE